MLSYKISVAAAADLDLIGEFGIRNFGLDQALRYHRGLEQRFELLARHPGSGASSAELRPGLFKYQFEAHMIFYTVESDHVLIVRIIRASADFKRHL